MINRFFQRKTLWWPKLPGWILLLTLAATPILLWAFRGEAFLSRTDREPAEVLVVEGWIGIDGMPAAKAEFEHGGYDRIVTSGGLSDERTWMGPRWNFPELARSELIRLGIPADKVTAAQARAVSKQRTFESARSVKMLFQAQGRSPAIVNVFTQGAHARRSRLIYAKALAPETTVGVIAWLPADESSGAWWASSVRAQSLIKETAGWLFEVLLNSGRASNSAAAPEKKPRLSP